MVLQSKKMTKKLRNSIIYSYVFNQRECVISHQNRQHQKAEWWLWQDQTLPSAAHNQHSVRGSSPTFHDLVESDTARPDEHTALYWLIKKQNSR